MACEPCGYSELRRELCRMEGEVNDRGKKMADIYQMVNRPASLHHAVLVIISESWIGWARDIGWLHFLD